MLIITSLAVVQSKKILFFHYKLLNLFFVNITLLLHIRPQTCFVVGLALGIGPFENWYRKEVRVPPPPPATPSFAPFRGCSLKSGY